MTDTGSQLPEHSEIIEKFLRTRAPSNSFELKQLKTSHWNLERRFLKKSSRFKRRKRRSKLNRMLKLCDLKEHLLGYDTFLHLHEMWLQYFAYLFCLKDKKVELKDEKLLHLSLYKADFHGCIVKLSRSKNPSNVGITGIILVETKNAFQIITPDGILKCIPKMNNVFTFEAHGFTFTLYGNHFLKGAGERSSRKLKSNATLDM